MMISYQVLDGEMTAPPSCDRSSCRRRVRELSSSSEQALAQASCGGYGQGLALQSATRLGQENVNAPFIVAGALTLDQRGGFQALEQWGEGAGIQRQALAQGGNADAI